jgi:hypothetical protein
MRNRMLHFDLNLVDFNDLKVLNGYRAKTKGTMLTAYVPIEKEPSVLERIGNALIDPQKLKTH